MKVIFVHDWLNGMRGGEKCLEALCEDFPQAPIFTLFSEPEKLSEKILAHPLKSSFVQKLPRVRTQYRNYLPLFPAAIESLALPEADLVISTSHCVAKSVKRNGKGKHLCYCFTPMRYAWTLFDDYFAGKNVIVRSAIASVMNLLRGWDARTSSRVDHFVAISHHIRKRIESCYGRTASVIYPPADTVFYAPDPSLSRSDFYLVVSALVPYKRVDLAVQVLSKMGRPLVVIGEGPEAARLKKMAGPQVQFLGWQPDEVLREYYRKARALIFPGEEDFGIVPVEAQACGCPVLALGRGGALETVVAGKTGFFFDSLDEKVMRSSVELFEKSLLNSNDCVNNAARFSRVRFKNEMNEMIQKMMSRT